MAMTLDRPPTAALDGDGAGDLLLPLENPKSRIDADAKAMRRSIFDGMAPRRDRYHRWHRYYYRQLLDQLRFAIPEGRRVLEVGCGDGWLLRQLRPSAGVGIDLSGEMIARAREATPEAERGQFRFEQADVENVTFGETFDYIVLSDLLGNLLDIQQAMENLRTACHENTRILITYHNMLWEPLLRLAGRMRLKMPSHHHNWIASQDIRTFLELAGFEIIRHQKRILAPKYVPLASWFLNRVVARMPMMGGLCLTNVVVARAALRPAARERSVTIVLPCRNERGNIRDAIVRTPAFGSRQEFVFVDGHSTDGTPDAVRAVMAEFPDKDIKLFTQEGKGKGDAVRLGFANASGDVLMILDTDLTMPPEDLPKFYHAVARGLAEFVNGSRLVYPMERQAMRFLNVLGNKFFSWALTRVLGQPLKDTLCGTKVLSKEHYERIVANRAQFGEFDPFGDFDLLFGAAKLNLRIVEIPIRYRDRSYGSTNISRFRHGWLLLRMTAFGFRKFR